MRTTYNKVRNIVRKFKVAIKKNRDLEASKQIDINNLRTVGLILGPYRNLSTITAAIIALHPSCQVLNHGRQRIFYDHRLDFFLNYSEKKFLDFVRYSIHISKNGYRGHLGGSITLAHTFDNDVLRERYRKRFGDALIKDKIEVLLWKEPQRIVNHIIENGVDLEYILNQNAKIKFLLPVRNPIDCAVANHNLSYTSMFRHVDKDSSIKQVLEAILEEYVWFCKLKKVYPERFFYFFQHEFSRNTLIQIADFLNIEPEKEWIDDSLKVFDIKSSYNHSEDLVQFYRKKTEKSFSDYHDFSKKLLCFVDK